MSTNTPDNPDRPDRPDRPEPDETTDMTLRPEPDETTDMTLRPEPPHTHEPTEALPLGEPQPAEPHGREPQLTQTLAPPVPPQAPPVVRGPYVAPVILGLVCLVIAAAAFAQEIAHWTIDWGNVGPLGIVIAGLVLVLLGGLGLLTSRRRRR